MALKGERFDANAFLPRCPGRRRCSRYCARWRRKLAGLPGPEVPDSLAALARAGAGWRATHLPLIGVTGSNGKTTVTQMIASILRAWQGEGGVCHAGNFNNDIGVPLMLMRLRAASTEAVDRTGHEPPRARSPRWQPWPSPRWPWSTTRSASIWSSCTRWRRWRARKRRWLAAWADGVAVFPAGTPITPLSGTVARVQRRRLTFGDGGDVRRAQATWEARQPGVIGHVGHPCCTWPAATT